MKFQALKGRHSFDDRCRVAPSGLQNSGNSATQGVALGWHIDAPLGLELQKAQLQKASVRANRDDALGDAAGYIGIHQKAACGGSR